MTTPRPNPQYPAIPTINPNDTRSMAAAILAMKEIIETLLGQRGAPDKAAVTVGTLPPTVTSSTTGPAGADGSDGAPGRDGVDGEDAWPIPGKNGVDGAPGAPGPIGVPGRDGEDADAWPIPGKNGVDGAPGAPGPIGVPGRDGEDADAWPVIGQQGPAGPVTALGFSGLSIANNAITPNTKIDIAPGSCASADNTIFLTLAATLTKDISAVWAVGNAGGLDTGTVAASTTYHMWLIRKTVDGSVDALFSLSLTTPTMPAGYMAKRYLWPVQTDASSHLIQFVQNNDTFIYTTMFKDVDTVNITVTTAVTRQLSVPLGIKVDAILHVGATSTDAGTAFDCRGLVSPFDQIDGVFFSSFFNFGTSNNNSIQTWVMLNMRTNTSGQIRSRNSAFGPGTFIWIGTVGYRFPRWAM